MSNNFDKFETQVLTILHLRMEAFLLWEQGKFLKAANAAFLPAPHDVARKLKEISQLRKRELRRERREAERLAREATEAERRQHSRLLEHARYARNKALGRTPADPTKPAVMKRTSGDSPEALRQLAQELKDEQRERKAARRKKAPAARKAAAKAIRHTAAFRRLNAAYQRYYHHQTPERWATYVAIRAEVRAESGASLREIGRKAAEDVYNNNEEEK